MSMKDIYKELKLRGYQYTGEFRGLKSASITGKNGHIAWTDNWVTFMDNMLQMMILGQKSRSLLVPTRIRKVVIDPKSHIQHVEKLANEENRFGILTKNRNELYEQLLSVIMPKGFLLTLEELDAIYDYSCLDKLKSFMNVENEATNMRIIVVAEGDFECGLIGLVNCLRKEPGGEMIRGVFIQDKDVPTFSLQESLYMKQLQLDLP
ncbi:fatty acid synthase, partial [Lasius niger]